MPEAANDLWVFGYGSLMWNPGFAFVERAPAMLNGYHRDFCIYSTHHRGSDERPGLVLGLDQGATCIGAAYRVDATDRAETLAYLRAREQVSGVYRESRVSLTLAQGSGHRHVEGIAYIVERAHPGYAGKLTLARQARLIKGARGLSGPNVEYLVQTWRLLRDAGIRDARLERLVTTVGGLFASGVVPVRSSSTTLIAANRQHPPAAPLLHRHQRRRFMHRIKLDSLKS